MIRFALTFAAVCASLCAQSPTDVFEKAPPKIDEALRERVKIFFQAHVDGKFRQAEAVIAEDSKDAFYNSEKKRYLSFEIVTIRYSDNFTKATVVTTLEMDWFTPPVGRVRVKPPVKSLWKFENGEWWWYVTPPPAEWDTPFGRMKAKPGIPADASADPGVPVPNPFSAPDAAAILQQVKASKTEIRLSSHEKSEETAEITNTMPGEIRLRIDQPSPATGLQITLDRDVLKSGETARLLFKYNPPDRTPKATLNVTVAVNPTGQTLPFQITFSVPPEYEKYLPKR